MSPVFLVVGATGKQGEGVVKALLDEGHSEIRGLTRNPDSPASKALSSKGVRLVKGSLLDKASLVEALKGATGAFLVTDPYGKEGVSVEPTQGKTFVDAAKEVGLEHLVFSSVDGAERNSGVPHFDTKVRVALSSSLHTKLMCGSDSMRSSSTSKLAGFQIPSYDLQ